MCPSSWKLYVDDFLFFGSPLAHLELELELFEVWDDGDDDLSHYSLSSADLMLDICGYFLSLRGPIVLQGVSKKLSFTN